MRLVDVGVTVKDRILLHLLDYWGAMHRAEWPVALTQDGIAGVVGISRSHVAVTLPDLIKDDMVEASTQRVEGRPRRVKVYSLTYRGGTYAGQLVQHLLRTEVTAEDDSGEWVIPLDGLIQVHKVHMLTALRTVDEDNRVDLRRALEMASAPEDAEERVTEEMVTEEEVTEEMLEVPAEAEQQLDGEDIPVGPVEEEPSIEELMATGPVVSAAGDADGMAEAAAVLGVPAAVGGSGARASQVAAPPSGHTTYQAHQMYYWSPLRFGTGRKPTAAYVSTMLIMGFVFLASAVSLLGLEPLACSVVWVPLAIIGLMFASAGFKSSWALGERREVWTTAALSAYMLLAVIMLLFAAFGDEVVLDLLWAGLILGIPCLVLAAGTGRRVERRGSFMLLIGPVMVIASVTMAVLDPEGMGRTGAMPILIIAVGVAWALLGWMMVRDLGKVETTPMVVAGGSLGLAISALAGVGNMAVEGSLSAVTGTAVALWVAGAVYVAAVSVVPSMAHLRPDARTVYTSLAVAGAAGLLTASAFFVWGGLVSVGVLEAVIAVGMLALVAPEMSEGGSRGLVLTVLGVMIAAVTVLAVSVGL